MSSPHVRNRPGHAAITASRAAGGWRPGRSSWLCRACGLVLAIGVVLPASAPHYALALSRLDPAAVLSLGEDVLLRAPDPALHRLFTALHARSRSDA